MPNVNVNFQASGTSISIDVHPNRVHVPQGNQTLTWNLSGTPGAAFPTAGIVFKPASGWTWGNPVTAPGGKTASVTYNNNVGKAQVYGYVLAITFNGVTYSYDPEVGNDPPGSMAYAGSQQG